MNNWCRVISCRGVCLLSDIMELDGTWKRQKPSHVQERRGPLNKHLVLLAAWGQWGTAALEYEEAVVVLNQVDSGKFQKLWSQWKLDVRLLHPSLRQQLWLRDHRSHKGHSTDFTHKDQFSGRGENHSVCGNTFITSSVAEKSCTMSFTLSGIMGSVGFGWGGGLLELDCTAAASIQPHKLPNFMEVGLK